MCLEIVRRVARTSPQGRTGDHSVAGPPAPRPSKTRLGKGPDVSSYRATLESDREVTALASTSSSTVQRSIADLVAPHRAVLIGSTPQTRKIPGDLRRPLRRLARRARVPRRGGGSRTGRRTKRDRPCLAVPDSVYFQSRGKALVSERGTPRVVYDSRGQKMTSSFGCRSRGGAVRGSRVIGMSRKRDLVELSTRVPGVDTAIPRVTVHSRVNRSPPRRLKGSSDRLLPRSG